VKIPQPRKRRKWICHCSCLRQKAARTAPKKKKKKKKDDDVPDLTTPLSLGKRGGKAGGTFPPNLTLI